jgi:hypothetical protein
LLIPDLYIPPAEYVKQFSVSPQVLPIVPGGIPWLNNNLLGQLITDVLVELKKKSDKTDVTNYQCTQFQVLAKMFDMLRFVQM